jgi:hypothetical protein
VKRFSEPHHFWHVGASIDIHQHLWPETLLRALERRHEPPMLLRSGRGWALRLAGAAETLVDLEDHDPDRRAAIAATDGFDRVLIAPSVPLGIEALSAGEAEPLLAAYHDGVAALPAPFGAWAAVGLDAPDPPALAPLLDDGFAGACVSAGALGDRPGYERLGPVLELLERRDRPLLVHPGPAAAPDDAPPWWSALTSYVASMHTAWYAFLAWGRRAHPRLRVCFAMLAGLAPLHRERLTTRGGSAGSDAGVFLDVSSYGNYAVDAVVREIGVDQLVLGSDRPVVAHRELTLGDAVRAAIHERNPRRLLSGAGVGVAA